MIPLDMLERAIHHLGYLTVERHLLGRGTMKGLSNVPQASFCSHLLATCGHHSTVAPSEDKFSVQVKEEEEREGGRR